MPAGVTPDTSHNAFVYLGATDTTQALTKYNLQQTNAQRKAKLYFTCCRQYPEITQHCKRQFKLLHNNLPLVAPEKFTVSKV